MKKIFLSILVASAAFFGCGSAKAQIAVNFTAEEMNPEYAELANAVIQQQTADPEAANKTFKKLLGKVKKDKEQAVAVGKFFLDKNVYPCAKQCANIAYTVDHTYVPGLMLSVGVNLMRRNYGEAGAKLDEILANDPDNIEALRLSARVYKYVNPYAAKDILGQIIAKDPSNLDAYKQLGDIAYQLEEYKDACAAFKTFFDGTPNPTIDDLRSGENYLLSLMNQQDAYTMKEMAIKLLPIDPKDMVVRRMKFFADMDTYDYAAAKEDIGYIVNQEYNDTLYLYLDYVYAANYASEVEENLEQAVEYYKKGLAIDPTKTAGYKEVANLYRRLKNPAEGVAYYEKYIELLGEKADEADKLGLGVYLTSVKDAIPNKEDGSVDTEARLAVIQKADPYFDEYMRELPDKFQGPFYRAKLWIRDNQAAEDEPKMWYEKTLEIIASLPADEAEKAVSYKKTALTYLMIYYLKTNDDVTCKTYVDQILAIDPADKLANQVKSVLN